MYKLIIKGRLPSLNEFILADRTSKYESNNMKKQAQELIIWQIKQQLSGMKIENSVFIQFRWFVKNKKTDPDNISSLGRKFILDSLVKCGVLRNDGYNNIIGFADLFDVDKDNPRVELLITPGEEHWDRPMGILLRGGVGL